MRPAQLIGETFALNNLGERLIEHNTGRPARYEFVWAHSGGGLKVHVAQARDYGGLGLETLCGRPVTVSNVQPGPESMAEVCASCARVRERYYEMGA